MNVILTLYTTAKWHCRGVQVARYASQLELDFAEFALRHIRADAQERWEAGYTIFGELKAKVSRQELETLFHMLFPAPVPYLKELERDDGTYWRGTGESAISI